MRWRRREKEPQIKKKIVNASKVTIPNKWKGEKRVRTRPNREEMTNIQDRTQAPLTGNVSL